jgi:hypothetical protein
MPYGFAGARKVDANHAAIVDAARQCGCDVLDIHQLGHGYPDLVIFRGQRAWMVEIKEGKGRLTEDERSFSATLKTDVHVVRTIADVLTLIQAV